MDAIENLVAAAALAVLEYRSTACVVQRAFLEYVWVLMVLPYMDRYYCCWYLIPVALVTAHVVTAPDVVVVVAAIVESMAMLYWRDLE